jgi:hypothetical protein
MVSVSYSLPGTGFFPPDAKQANALARIVDAAFPDVGLIRSTDLPEFSRALSAVGYMYRTAEPVSKYSFIHFVDAANDLLTEHLHGSSVSGTAVFGAVLAHADICWRKADRSLGQMLEVGLDLYQGRMCENAWRGLLTGERNLMTPTPPRDAYVAQAGKGQKTTFWRQDENGKMRSLRPDEPMWSKS